MLCLPSTVTFPQSVRIKENLKIIYFNFIILLFPFISTISLLDEKTKTQNGQITYLRLVNGVCDILMLPSTFYCQKICYVTDTCLTIPDPHLPLYSNIFVDKDADWRGVIHILLGNIFEYFCILMPNTHARILCFALIISGQIG